MTMIGATDILIQTEPNRDRLRIAVSRAFGVDPGHVTVDDAEGTTPILDDAEIILLRQPGDMPGDFPAWYSQAVTSDLADRVNPSWDVIAHELGTVILSEAPDYKTIVHLPNGTGHVLYVPEEDEGGYRITPELRRLIDRATPSVAVAS